MKKPQILVVGSMNMDLCMYGMSGLPRWGESTFCTDYGYAVGGKGSNQAMAAAIQGADTYMLGKIGDDEHGKQLLTHLEEAGVHTEYVIIDPEARTGFSTMNMGEEGKYFSIYAAGANTKLQVSEAEAVLEQKKFDMIVMQLEMPLAVAYRICELGAKKQIPIFLDAGPAMSIPLEKLRGTFIISPNEAETAALTGITPDTEKQIEAAASILYEKAQPEYVLLKLGKRGAYLYGKDVKKQIPGFQVEAIDTTAAGDTFGAAFCVKYVTGTPLEEAIRYGHAAAAICVTRKGGQPSIPKQEEVEAFYQKWGGTFPNV